jgi:hypothetical protein
MIPLTPYHLFVLLVAKSLRISDQYEPFKIAAFADLIANEAMLAMTSGRASKMIKSTPIGHD